MKNLQKVFFIIFSLFILSVEGFGASNNPNISISNASINEGSGTKTVTLTVSITEAPDKKDIELSYTTNDGSAKAPTNYTSSSGNMTFQTGSTASKTINIVVNSDVAISNDIQFTVSIANNKTNAAQTFTITNATSTITIVNQASNVAPTANTGGDRTTNQNTAINITGSGSDTDGTISSYSWKDENGNIFNSQTISSSNFAVGIHTLTLTVTDNNGATATDSMTLTITNAPPTANTGGDRTTNQNTAINITGSGSDTDGTISSYSWYEGANFITNSATISSSGFGVGTHTLTLMVTDNNGATATDTMDLTIENSPPTANAGADQSANVGDSVTLSGSGSSDVGGSIVSYEWSMGGVTLSNSMSFSKSDFAIGVNAVTLIVTDNNGDTDSDIVIVDINNPPTADAGADKSANLGESVSIVGSGSDTDGIISSYSWYEGATPKGTSATLTRSDFSAGSHTLTLIVKDNGGATGEDSMILYINSKPIANAQTVSTSEDTPIDINLTASDIDVGDTLTFHKVADVTDGTISGTLPNITYTPDSGFSGEDSFTFYVDDGSLDSDTVTVKIIVSNQNQAPTATEQNLSTDANVAIDIALSGSDPEGDTLSYTLGTTLPLHGTLTGTPPNIKYTPDTDYDGADEFTFRVNDGSLDSNEATISISVLHINQKPTALPQSLTINENTSLSITLSGTDLESTVLIYTDSIVTYPLHGSLSGTGQNRTYTPNSDYVGLDSFTFKVNDGSLDSDVATISISVLNVNKAPTANSQSISTNENISKGITLTGSDPDGDSLSYTIMSNPSHGSLSGTLPNITYTPVNNYDGADSFTFRVDDGSLNSNTATISISVLNVNKAPTANAQSVTTDANLAKSITLTGSDPDGDSLSYIILSSPSNGSLSGTAPNIIYSPNTDYSGSDSFTFKVNDGSLDSATATVSITVSALPSNSPNIKIDPTTKSIVEGTTSVSLDVVLSEVANSDDIKISYSNSCDSSTGVVTIAKGDTKGSITVDTSSLLAGASCDIKLTSATGSGSQTVGTISPDTSTIDVTSAGTCSATDKTINVGANNITNLSASSSGDYHKLIITADGTLSVSFENLSNKTSTFFLGTSCDDKSLYDGSATALTHTVADFAVSSGDVIFVLVSDTGNNEDYTIDITLSAPNNPPTFTSTPVTEAFEYTPYSYVITTNDADGDFVTVTATTIPDWLTFDGTNVTLSGNPTSIDVGSYDITLTADDGKGGVVTQEFTITVSSLVSNHPVLSISPATKTIAEGISSFDLYIDLDVAPNRGELIVSFTNDINNSTGTFIIAQNASSATLTIDSSAMVRGNTYTITLTGATGVGDQEDGSIDGANDLSKITVIAPSGDLTISKESNSSFVAMSSEFIYTIQVSNIGSEASGSVVVTDTLPVGVTADLSKTNAQSIGWSCTGTTTIECSYSGDISPTESKSINLYVTAPSAEQTITNTVSVTSNSDYDTTNNSATVNTKIVDGSYKEKASAPHLCYKDVTSVPISCEKAGNFYYGNGCTAEVMIQADFNLTADLTDVNITEMISVSNNKDLDAGSCSSTKGNCTGPNPFAPDWSPSYLEAYMVPDVGTMSSGEAITITDRDTHNGKPIQQIAIYATYKYSGVNYYGRVYSCLGLSEGGVELTSAADVIDTPIDASNRTDYDNSSNTSDQNGNLKFIRTMASGEIRSMTGVHLDAKTRKTKVYTSPTGSTLPFYIMPYLVDDQGGECEGTGEVILGTGGEQLLITINSGEISAQEDMMTPLTLKDRGRLQLILVDPNLLGPAGQGCLANSSTTGNLAGIGQCANSATQYIPGFGVDAFDRCSVNNGDPCLSKNGGWSCGEKVHAPTADCPTYNPLYDHPLGCFMCTFNARPSCSTDNFAIRPARFEGNITHTDGPNLLRAGKDYGMSLTAVNDDGSVATTYNVADATVFEAYVKKFFKSNWTIEDTLGVLHGDATVSMIGNPSMIAGLSNDSTNGGANPDPILNVAYDDVGEVSLFVYDKAWGEVDYDDTPQDCTSEFHTYICGEQNVTFIPNHFSFPTLTITNHSGPNSILTYIANERNDMAGHINTVIEARTADDSIAQNFRADSGGNLFYENPVSLSFIADTDVATYPDNAEYTRNWDANESSISLGLLGFGTNGDANGVVTIPWNETNISRRLEFNFKRAQNIPANPFMIDGERISISMTSSYTDPIDGDTADIIGSRIGDLNTSTCIAPPDGGCVRLNADGNATFYFGRTRPSREFYEDIRDVSIPTPISIDVFCDLGYTACDNLGIDTISGQIDELNWWIATEHNSSIDGSVSIVKEAFEIEGSSADWTLSPTTLSINKSSDTPGVDESINVGRGTNPTLPLTVGIDLDIVSPWLIYNPNSLFGTTTPFYKVRFVGDSQWGGFGKRGNIVDINASSKRTKRLDW